MDRPNSLLRKDEPFRERGRNADDLVGATTSSRHEPSSDEASIGDSIDAIDEQSEQSFPASDPPSWSGLSI
jgi:hypothetical protein